MQQILEQAIEQMIRLGNALNWNPPIDREYVNMINELRALRDATQPSVEPTLDTSPVFVPKPCVVCGQMVCNH